MSGSAGSESVLGADGTFDLRPECFCLSLLFARLDFSCGLLLCSGSAGSGSAGLESATLCRAVRFTFRRDPGA